jgi:hypothetical protein
MGCGQIAFDRFLIGMRWISTRHRPNGNFIDFLPSGSRTAVPVSASSRKLRWNPVSDGIFGARPHPSRKNAINDWYHLCNIA